MGMVFLDVLFQGQTPQLSNICSKITEVCSLPVVIQEYETNDLHEFDAMIAFECAPDLPIRIYCYQEGAVARSCDQDFDEPSLRDLMKNTVQGANEVAGTQTVYIRGYVGQEPTLMITTTLALESLGGIPTFPITDDKRQEYGKIINETELNERCRKMHREIQKSALIVIASLPLLIPLLIIKCIWELMTLPFQIKQMLRRLDELERKS